LIDVTSHTGGVQHSQVDIVLHRCHNGQMPLLVIIVVHIFDQATFV